MSKRHVVFCYIVAAYRGSTAPPRRGPVLGEHHAAYSGSAQRRCRHAIEGEIMRLRLKLVDETGTEHWTAGECAAYRILRAHGDHLLHDTLVWRWRR